MLNVFSALHNNNQQHVRLALLYILLYSFQHTNSFFVCCFYAIFTTPTTILLTDCIAFRLTFSRVPQFQFSLVVLLARDTSACSLMLRYCRLFFEKSVVDITYYAHYAVWRDTIGIANNRLLTCYKLKVKSFCANYFYG